MSVEPMAFSITSGISILLVLIPLPCHLVARNYVILPFACWLLVGCLIYFTNSLLWRKNVQDFAPIWCDLSSKLLVGLSVGLPSSILCINRQLFDIVTSRSLLRGASMSHRGIFCDVGLSIGIPCLIMIIHVGVQGHRFDLVEDIGCEPSTSTNSLVIPLYLIWPPIIGIVSLVYSAFAVKAFLKQRHMLPSNQTSSFPARGTVRFIRLTAFSAVQVLLLVPSTLLLAYLYFNRPWDASISNTSLSTVVLVPREILEHHPSPWLAVRINRWLLPIGCLSFFTFFGLSSDLSKFYSDICKPFLSHLHCGSNGGGTKYIDTSSTHLRPIQVQMEQSIQTDPGKYHPGVLVADPSKSTDVSVDVCNPSQLASANVVIIPPENQGVSNSLSCIDIEFAPLPEYRQQFPHSLHLSRSSPFLRNG